MMDEINYESLDYGAYWLDYETSYALSENVKWANAEFNKLNVRRIRLPDGRGNIVYLLSDTFENTLRMTQSKNFIIPPTYRKLHYPWISFGQFMGRRYRFNITKQRQSRIKTIKEHTKFIPYATRHLQKSRENIFFSVSDLLENVKPIMERFPIKKIFLEFFEQFDGIISNMTPPPDKESDDKGWNNRILIIDADGFKFKNGASLKDNKTNPLFLIYLAFLRTRDLSKLNVDRDMLICSKNMFMKFNPARMPASMWAKFRIALFKIMNANLDNYTSQLTDEEKEEINITSTDHITHAIVTNTLKPYTKNISPSTAGVLIGAVDSSIRSKVLANQAIAKLTQHEQEEIQKNINPDKPSLFQQVVNDDKKNTSVVKTDPYSPVSKRRMDLFDAIVKDYRPLSTRMSNQFVDEDEIEIINDYEDEIEDDVNDIIDNDDGVISEVLDEIQDKVAPMRTLKTSPVSSARDKKLREERKEIVVRDSTIGEILERDAANIPIETSDKSPVLKTTNTNMHNVTFANFDKTYIEKMYTRDILECFDSLKDKSSPLYITSINIEDTSDDMDLKETWTVKMIDEYKNRHTIVVDIPKFKDNRFMWFGGNKNIILKQNLYNPLVKDTNDEVIVTTNLNKITIERKSTKSLADVEKIFTLSRKSEVSEVFTPGDSTIGNGPYISTIEYDELARRIFKFQSGKCELYFSREYLKQWLQSEEGNMYRRMTIKGNLFPIGVENGSLLLIDEDTGKDQFGRSIVQIIEQNLSDEHKAIFNSVKAPKQSMFAEATLSGQKLPVATILVAWVGISTMLDKMDIQWEFYPNQKRIPKGATNRNYIRFSDGILEYESKVFAELIMNGMTKMNPDIHTFEEFNSEDGYQDYIYSVWGNYRGFVEIKNFYEWLMDPITKAVCRDLFLPTEPDELIIHAVKLLQDNKSVSKANDTSYRLRSVETIPAILYCAIASQYKDYVKRGTKGKMTLDRRIIISTLQKEKTVKPYSTLNPAIEVGEFHTVSPKGFKGSNSDFSYDQEKRSYDPSSIGKIAMSTSADANVGINRELVVEPTLTNVRGYRDPVEDIDILKDVNLFSPVEMLTPGTVRNDDPIRTAIANKQSQHLVPVADAAPTLVSNGYDEAIQFHLSNDFVINAEEDGKVIEIDEDTGFIVVQYKSGKNFAFSTNPEIVKNMGGGFFISNKLKPRINRVGQTFKKDEVLAYHDKYFRESKLGGVRYAIGPLVKMAFMSSYNTYEDAGICTMSLAEKMKTNIVYQVDGTFEANSNIVYMVKIGDKVNIGDTLIRYSNSFDDSAISAYLTKLSERRQVMVENETKSDIRADHAGTIIDIKIYSLLEPSNLSPSLAKLVQEYFDKGLNKKKFLEKYDNSPGIIKAGYMLTDSTKPTVTRYNTIKRYKGIDVLIEIYIENYDVMGVGDKIALYSANKQIVSEVIPEGYEPYSEFRPDEEISVMTSPGTIARRMTPAVMRVSAATKVLIETKRKIAAEIKYK